MSLNSGGFLGGGRFEVKERLGAGGMGTVFTAYDTERKEEVALKLLHTRDASALYRFKKEFRTLADVSHRNLVSLYELVVQENQWFFTMEIIGGSGFFPYVRPGAMEERVGALDESLEGELDFPRLRHALRQSPDVILIGEMRDAETVSAALDATETGHLVMSTLHTVNAPQTVDRILSFFQTNRHQQIRQRLAENLAAVMSLRLLPKKSGVSVPISR